jgi:hypothetical protein
VARPLPTVTLATTTTTASTALDAARADHIRMILGCGRTVVPRQVAAVRADRVHRRSSEGIWTLTEPGRNAIAGEQAAGEVSAGQRLRTCAWMAVCETVGLAYVGSTQHLPLPAETARGLGIPGLAGLLCLVPLCFVVCRCEPLRSNGYGHSGRNRSGAGGSPHRLLQDFDGPLAALRSLQPASSTAPDRHPMRWHASLARRHWGRRRGPGPGGAGGLTRLSGVGSAAAAG